jgi:TonB family protein
MCRSAWFFVFPILSVVAFTDRVSAAPLEFTKFRVVWADGRSEVVSKAVLHQYTVVSPFPDYPPEVWPRGGSGVFELRIRKDGGVSGIVITKSTGEPLLDRAAMRALIRYRFKPGVFRKVYEPIDYTVTRYR